MNGFILTCPACDSQWPVGPHVGDLERHSLESGPCPRCGCNALHCRPLATPSRNRRGSLTNEKKPALAGQA